MKKFACAIFILMIAIFIMNPVSSEARGWHGGWWGPRVIVGWPYYDPYYYPPYYSPYYYPHPPVIIREQPSTSSAVPSTPDKLFVYPRQGQSEEQKSKDLYECHSWAVGQTGYDPTQPSASNMTEAQRNQMRADYQRAQGACLDGRGYTTK
jgi:hypothetical protein